MIRRLHEGNAIRAIVRLAGVAEITGGKLLADVGFVCSYFQDYMMLCLAG